MTSSSFTKKLWLGTFLITLGMFFGVYTAVFASAPTRDIGFQGQLFTGTTPVNASVNATFTFYNAASLGSAQGTPISKTISVSNGYFATTFSEADTTGIDFAQSLWIEVTVNGDTLSPRSTIHSAPLANSALGVLSYLSAPGVGPAGSLYYNASSSELFISNGSSWGTVSTSTPSIWDTVLEGISYNGGNVGIGTTTPGSLLSLGNSGGINFSLATSTFFSTGGINLASGCFAVAGVCLTNSTYGDSAVNSYIHASTTIPKTYTANTFTGSNVFSGSLTFGSLNGPLQANGGVVSATSSIGVIYGGTGLTSAPTYGQVLLGNSSGGYTLTATSSLGISQDLSGYLTGATDSTLTKTGQTLGINLSNANTWTGQQTFNTSAPIFGTMTAGSALFAGTSGLLSQDNANYFYDSTNHRLGLGTTTPWGLLSVNPNGISGPAFVVGSSTATSFVIGNSGAVGIGTSTPNASRQMITAPSYSLTSGTGTFTASVSNGYTVITGTGTSFLSEMKVGDVFGHTSSGNNGVITNISSNTTLYVEGTNLSGRSGNFGYVKRVNASEDASGRTFFAQSTPTIKTAGGTYNSAGTILNSGYFFLSNTGTPYLGLTVRDYAADGRMILSHNGSTGSYLLFTGSSANIIANALTIQNSFLTGGSRIGGAGASTGENSLYITSTGTGASQTIQVSTESYSSNVVQPAISFAATSFAFKTRNTTWNDYQSGNTTLSLTSDGLVGVGTTSPWRTLSVTGTAAINGLSASGATDQNVCINQTTKEITYGTSCIGSSERFKHNIETLDTAQGLDLINKLRPVSFIYNDNNAASLGFIAEEVNTLEPRLVFYEADGVTPKGVRYENFAPVIVKSIQELDLNLNGIVMYGSSTLATSTTQTFAKNFFDTVFKNVSGWLATAGNGISNVFSEKVSTKTLCIGDTCVSEDEFKTILQKSHTTSTPTPTVIPPPAPDKEVVPEVTEEVEEVVDVPPVPEIEPIVEPTPEPIVPTENNAE